MTTIEDTLRELDRWYNELPGGNERPIFLSKLAILELCGWIETRFDALIRTASVRAGLDQDWVESNIVQRTHGFAYADHFRHMLCRIVGESAVLHVESTFEQDSPGRLELLKSALGTLWKNRGPLAHSHIAAPVATQRIIYAPSWSVNQQRVVAKMIDQFEASLIKAFGRTIAKP
ncbi:MAG TPA: hypothetical protein VI837_03960 [Blastocatellia bacterium]|nr:hypothetical protein [Blastocatellia bacterium]